MMQDEIKTMVDEIERLRDALQEFLTAYGSQESCTAGLDKAADQARARLSLSPSERGVVK